MYLPAAEEADYASLTRAYEFLRLKAYEQAITAFEEALSKVPAREATHKDLAYTYLKIGENNLARLHFGQAMQIEPKDTHVALEYAFLCFESKDDAIHWKAVARRIFAQHRADNPVAEQAFQNIDTPLRDGIQRWQEALTRSDSFSAHQELAQLAETRDELPLAAEHYRKAFELLPARKSVLLDLGRVLKNLNQAENANAVLLAASRGGEARTAEQARELLPSRYPFVYEFRNALALDPGNTELHRELAYLLLSMQERQAAELEFQTITQSAPEDLLSAAQLGFLYLGRKDHSRAMPLLQRVLEGKDEELANRVRLALNLAPKLNQGKERGIEANPREMAERSLKAGYLKDALRYLKLAQEDDPVDFNLMLKLGWAYNLLHDDRNAFRWFSLARQSPDLKVAGEAEKAYNALRPSLARFRTTAWLFPVFSTRWNDLFAYGQVKTDVSINRLPFRPYVSVRFIGDTRQSIPGVTPQNLSESAFIFAVGANRQWHRVTVWGEAGSMVSYTRGHAVPDYRGGLSSSRVWRAEESRLFLEGNFDGVFLSRYENDFLTYGQTKAGLDLKPVQIYVNMNLTMDVRQLYWANFAETGPGIRYRNFSVNFLRGVYLVNKGNPRRPNFFDLRAGFWYAVTH